jgi:hypothetical protein
VTRDAKRQQSLARSRVVDYIARLGLNKAARRLSTTPATVRRWLARGFPQSVLGDALEFSGSGGLFVSVPRSSAKDLVAKLGRKKVQKLTGLTAAQLSRRVLRDLAIAFRRPAIVALVKKEGLHGVAQATGLSVRQVDRARKPVLTSATERLKTFVKKYGIQAARKSLGVPEARLQRWLEWNVPRSWAAAVDRKVKGPWARPLPPEKHKVTKRLIESAKAAARKWNKEVPPKFRITQREAEKQARLGTWDEHIARARELLRAKPRKPPRKAPKPPPIPPKVPRPSLTPKPTPPLRERPEHEYKPPPPGAAEAAAIKNFQEMRIEAYATGTADMAKRYRDAPWGRKIKVSFPDNIFGWIVYGKVWEFVHVVDLDKLGRRIIEKGLALWKKFTGGLMTLRWTLSAQGSGNPFYVGAFIPDANKLTFFRLHSVEVRSENEIATAVWSTIDELYQVGHDVLLMIEHWELARSNVER